MPDQALSPPSKKRRVQLVPEEEGGDVMASKGGRLWELATLACRLAEAEEEERRKRKGKAVAFLDVGSCSTSNADGEEEEERRKRKGNALTFLACRLAEEEEEEERRKRKGKAVAFLDVGSCSAAKNVHGEKEEEEEEQMKEMGKAVAFSDAGSCSTSGRKRKGKAETFLVMGSCSTSGAATEADGEAGKQCTYKTGCKKQKAAPEDHPSVPKRGGTTTSSAKNNRPYKIVETARPRLMGWVEKAVRMGGTAPRLVVKKEMTNTDIDPYFGRLPLPSARPADPSKGGVQLLLDELSPAEKRAVRGAGLPITVLDRWGREYVGATLKLWADKWYVITGGHVWKRVIAGNALKRGDVVEVFRFRIPPPPPTRTEGEGGDGRRGEADGRLVLVVSVSEASNVDGEERGQQEEEHHWGAANIPRKSRGPSDPQRPRSHPC